MSEPAPPRLRYLVLQFALAAAVVVLQDRELRETVAERWRAFRATSRPVSGPEPSPVEYARVHDRAREIAREGGE